ncbi:hypothetical protein AB4124_04700 [Paenibacillus sp. 2KB_20]|uniref:hypothetical protein n=1 Tax=Paenibacillus sp. 2KB_20 TaxID=3232977 RepID=UPI003F9D95F4
MSDADGAEILRAYREGFQPSAHLQEPRAMVAVSVVCAKKQEEAEKLAADNPQPGQRNVAADPKQGLCEADARYTPCNKTTQGQEHSLDSVSGKPAPIHETDVSRAIGRRDTTPAGDGYAQGKPSEETRGSQVASDGSTSAGPPKRLIVGPPASVRGRLQEMAEQYGCDEFLIVRPASDYRACLESYRLLMEQQ